MLLSEPTQPVVCSVVDNMLPLVFESWPGQVPPIFFFFFSNLAEKLIPMCGRKRNNGSSS